MSRKESEYNIGKQHNVMGGKTRNLAFRAIGVFLIGTFVGSVLPESGNVLTRVLGIGGDSTHIFNPCFLLVGIIGIVLALYFGYRKSS